MQGGVETHCEHLYPQLVKLGCRITVFSRKPYVAPGVQMFRGVSVIPVDCPSGKFLEAIIHTCKCVFLAYKMKPDILHIHAIGPSLFAPLARFLGMKVVVTNHGPDYMRKKWPLPARIFLKFCERMGATFANMIITISANLADDVKRKYNRESIVIPNGVQIPVLSNTDYALRQYGLQSKKYILAVGRLVPEKGFHDLIDAFSEANINDWKLVIVGRADHEDAYSKSLEKKASENRDIILTGFQKGQPLQELYSHAGLFVLPSHHEGLPIVLLEAMSYGLSCIASDIPANRNVELIRSRFFRAGDIAALAEKIDEFVHKSFDEEDRKSQLRMIAEKYNWEKIARQTLEVYKSATVSPKRSAV